MCWLPYSWECQDQKWRQHRKQLRRPDHRLTRRYSRWNRKGQSEAVEIIQTIPRPLANVINNYENGVACKNTHLTMYVFAPPADPEGDFGSITAPTPSPISGNELLLFFLSISHSHAIFFPDIIQFSNVFLG